MSNIINYPIQPLMLRYSIERLEKERLELLNDALAPEVFCKLKKCAAFLNPVTEDNKHEFLQEWTNSLEWDDIQKSIMNGTYKGEIIEPKK